MNTDLQRAIRTLEIFGFTDLGGELWKPPVRKDIYELRRKIYDLENELSECKGDSFEINVHYLKTDRNVFQDVWNDLKTFEIRYDDRNYKVNDILVLRKTVNTGEEMKAGYPLIYTGEEIIATVSYKLTGYGLKDNWCILGLKNITKTGISFY